MNDNPIHKFRVGEWTVEIQKDGDGWKVDSGNLLLTTWTTVLCPTFEKVLETLVLISKGKPTNVPESCTLKPYLEEK